jgi:hypothetical protein
MNQTDFSSRISPQTAKMIVIAWVCMFIAIGVVAYFTWSHARSDKDWCRAHNLAVYDQEHPAQVYCQDARGIRKRPGEYPVENSLWVIEPSMANDAPAIKPPTSMQK